MFRLCVLLISVNDKIIIKNGFSTSVGLGQGVAPVYITVIPVYLHLTTQSVTDQSQIDVFKLLIDSN